MNGSTTCFTLEAWIATLNLDTPHSRARLQMIRRGLADGRCIRVESDFTTFDLRLDPRGCFELVPLRDGMMALSA